MDVVKPDPAVTQETPEPIVYRCRKCRRVIATKSNLLTHKQKPPGQSPAKLHNSFGDVAGLNDDESDNEQQSPQEDGSAPTGSEDATAVPAADTTEAKISSKEGPSMCYVTEQMRRSSITSDLSQRSSEKDGVCSKIYFTEPLAWMTDIFHNTQGRLYCPKCTVKLGSFNWVMATKCPCGAEIYPAFYLVPSKTEYSTVVQNVQVTV